MFEINELISDEHVSKSMTYVGFDLGDIGELVGDEDAVVGDDVVGDEVVGDKATMLLGTASTH